ncbi:MAG: VWA domain-containing protein [Brumimicrobium sp.]|nr:VWA domain-containing protein [Brumimicrobium sp.]
MKKLICIFFLILSGISYSQEELTRILFLFDASNSMNQRWGRDTRFNVAKDLLIRSIDSLRGVPNLEIGLRVYGHQSPVTATYQDCADTKLEVPFSKNNHDVIVSKIKGLRAKGTTPIARSLEASAADFPDRNSRNIIILITDGVEACDDEPCVIADKLRAKGITISPFVIGLGMDMSYLDQFDCIGKYKSAEDPMAFQVVLKDVINQALVNTTVQINLNTIYGTPKETDVTMFLYEAGTRNLVYTFTHTLNEKNLPDTLIMDPSKKYDLIVKTLPEKSKYNITIKRNTHNIIELDTPQGLLEVTFDRPTSNNFIDVRVMQEGQSKTLNVQKFQEIQKYIVGKYDLEILTLPRRYRSIEINQSSTTNVRIEAPGTVNFQSAKPVTGQIFEIMDNNRFEWVCDLNENTTKQNFTLQPGKYLVVSRKKHLRSTNYTQRSEFSIYSNKSVTLNL